jgi:tetratricopeptide (TPR) repeat protein
VSVLFGRSTWSARLRQAATFFATSFATFLTRSLATSLAALKTAVMLWRTVRPSPRAGSMRGLRSLRERYLVGSALFYLGFHRPGATARDPAVKYCRMLAREHPDSSAIALALGQRWLDAGAEEFGRSDEPLRCFSDALALQPDSAEAAYGLGMTHQHRGNAKEAAAAYYAVLRHDPGHVAARFRLWCLSREGHLAPDSCIEPYQAPGAHVCEIAADAAAAAAGAATHEVARIRAVQRAGTVIVRNAIGGERVAQIRELADRFAKSYDYRASSTIRFTDSPPPLQAALNAVVRTDLLGRLLPLFSAWYVRGWTPLPSPAWWIQYFPPPCATQAPFRSGTPLHQDHPVHYQQSDWTTFWTALSPCGPGVASTLRVLSVPLRHPIDGFDNKLKRINPVAPERIVEFFGGAMVSLVAAPGDVVSFGRHMLHHTVFDPQMSAERLSFDVRWKTGPSRLDLSAFV